MTPGEAKPAAVDAFRVTVTRPWLSSLLGWLAFLLAMAPLFGAVLAAGLLHWSKPWWWQAFMGVCWLGAPIVGLLALVAARVPWRRWPRARVGVSAEGLTVQSPAGETTAGAAQSTTLAGEVASAATVPGVGAVLRLEGGRRVTVETTEDRADALVSALDLEAGRRRLETRLRPSAWRGALGGAGIVALYALAMKLAPKARELTRLDALVFFAATVALLATIVLITKPPQIEVGADGVTVRRRRGARFLPFSELKAARLDRGRLSIELHDGQPVRISCSAKNEAQLRAAWRRIQVGLAAHQAEADAPARLELLAREGRSLESWRADLAKLVRLDAGFRRAAVSRDDVQAILTSPTTLPEHRIGAGLALRELDGDGARAPIRIAAEACADEPLREALLRLAEGEAEQAAIEEALASEERGRLRN